ncbi:MAG TPA: DUF3592 domain-containing protein [Steroidobacteraceae bacterium]|jgi:hypothetical protein|nr:DUF3592 domain-containing protein [Steroidobacteraceae bacterium]
MALRLLDLSARLLFALGLGCLVLAAYLSWRTLSFATDAQRTTAEVVSYREVRDGDETRHRPRLRFETATGEIIQFDSQVATTTERFKIGERLPVVYKAREPTSARVALFQDNWLGACIAVVIGLVGMAGGYLVRRAVKREISKTP